MSTQRQPTVAVIGLGAQGLVTVKNFLEQGFNVTGFDRNDYIGGIWHYSAENHISALPTTVVNVSRERASFTDFAFAPGTDSYPSSGQVDKYLNDYADAFNLRPHLHVSTSVHSIERDDAQRCWHVTISGSSSSEQERLKFDKIVMATGPHNKPVIPELPNREAFKGEIIHAIAFKEPKHFEGKRVLVVGVSNSAADTTTSLVGIASKVYLSHRHSSVILPRILKDGMSLDHGLSYRRFQLSETIDAVAPRLSMYFLDGYVNKIQQQEFGTLDAEWRLSPPPSLLHHNPTVTDTLVPALRAGTITSTHSLKRVAGDRTVELEDGSILTVDSIVYCTGYSPDYSILGKHDPTLNASVAGGHDNNTARLYQNIFSLEHPESLAFVGIAIIIFPAFLLSDLSSMAMAQVWSNRPASPSLPPQHEMEQWYAEHLNWVDGVRALSPGRKFRKYTVRSRHWLPWITQIAGCDFDDRLGYFTLNSWRLWWQDREFYNILANGIWSPHIYRLFDSTRPGGRRKWDGAQEAIIRVNKDVKAGLQRRRRERSQDEAKVNT